MSFDRLRVVPPRVMETDFKRAIEQLEIEAAKMPFPLRLKATLDSIEIEAAYETDSLTVAQVHTVEGALARVRGN